MKNTYYIVKAIEGVYFPEIIETMTVKKDAIRRAKELARAREAAAALRKIEGSRHYDIKQYGVVTRVDFVTENGYETLNPDGRVIIGL